MTTKSSILWLDGLGVGSAEAVLISAFVAGVVALMVVRRHRGISKRAKAYDIAQQFFGTERLEAESKVRAMSKTGNWTPVIGSEQEEYDTETRQQVLRCLNEWELMCVGIRKNIVDESVLKDAIGDRLVIIHRAASTLIETLRQQKADQEFFEHFEFIADKWAVNPRGLWRTVKDLIAWKIGRKNR